MAPYETIPHLSEEQFFGLVITTGEVVDSIESMVSSVANGTAWRAPKASKRKD